MQVRFYNSSYHAIPLKIIPLCLVNDPTKKAGYRLVGDVAYDEVKEVASYITPVPGNSMFNFFQLLVVEKS
jgi:hypothetical protein